jgi:ElaB/YqjD/DUF883 family membrane-anchored ribosome-binding protein
MNELEQDLQKLSSELEEVATSPVLNMTDLRSRIIANWNERLTEPRNQYEYLKDKETLSKAIAFSKQR